MSLPHHPVAVVTGASSGLGLSISIALAARGANLILMGRDSGRLAAAEAATRATGARGVRILRGDLSRDRELDLLCESLVQLNRLDVIIHSAGVASIGPVSEVGLAELDWQYRVNLRAPYALTQAALPALIASQGQVVFLNSGAGLNARGGWSQYAATKHGLKAFADSLRDEVQAQGVRVLSLYPGRTASPMQARIRSLENASFNPTDYIQPSDVSSTLVHALELSRTAHVVDINIRRGRS